MSYRKYLGKDLRRYLVRPEDRSEAELLVRAAGVAPLQRGAQHGAQPLDGGADHAGDPGGGGRDGGGFHPLLHPELGLVVRVQVRVSLVVLGITTSL